MVNTGQIAVTVSEKEDARKKLAVVAKQLAVTAKEKEDARKKLAVVAKQLAVTAKEKEDARKKLAVVAKQLAVTAKEKEDVRRKLAVTAGKLRLKAKQLAMTAEEKEDARKKLAMTTKRLAATANEKEDIRRKSEQLAATAKEKEDARKKLDAVAQKQASAYARSLIEASLDPLVTISPEGKITDVNHGSVKVTGVARDELIGTDFSDYFTEPNKAREGYQRVFAEGAVTDYPLTIRRRDGKLTDVLYNASVYRDSGGHVLGVFAAARDVTAQKHAQTAIAEQGRRELERLKETERLEELERFQRLTIGREIQMIKLKKEIEILKRFAPQNEGEPSVER